MDSAYSRTQRYFSYLIYLLASLVGGCGIVFWQAIASAQIIPDTTLGTDTSTLGIGTINNEPVQLIEGGATQGENLFHSFSDFNINIGEVVYFDSPDQINNILSRITGNNLSTIDGLLGVDGTANLFLLNPNGIVFGPDAQLDLNGSFIVSTADALDFENSGRFSTRNPNSPSPLLTVHPSALWFGQSAEQLPNSRIVVQSVYGDVGLAVPNQESLILVGADVSLEGGRLTSRGGRVEVGGLAAPGTIDLSIDAVDNNYRIRFPDDVQRSNVMLSDGAQVTVTAPADGNISVHTHDLTLSDRSNLNAGISPGGVESDAFAGDISVDATGDVRLENSSVIQNIVNLDTTGSAGKIDIRADSFSLISGSQLFATTYGTGDAGNVLINVQDQVLVDSAGLNPSTSSIISAVTDTASGNGGDVEISARSIAVINGGQLNAITSGQGNAGNFTLNVREAVVFDGANAGASGIINAVAPGARGDAGDTSITARTLSITNGAQLNNITRAQGNAGNVRVQASESIIIDGENPNSVNDPYSGVSAIFTSVGVDDSGNQAVGDGGDIDITTGSLSITNGAGLNAITRGQGNAGNVTIRASGHIAIDGERQLSSVPAVSSIFTSVDANPSSNFDSLGPAVGDGGDIDITASSLSLSGGGAVNGLTAGRGNAGNITIRARDRLSLDGASSEGTSGIFSSVASNKYTNQPPAVGTGGDVDITTGILEITRGAGIYANTEGVGDAGSVTIRVRDHLSLDGASSEGTSGIFSSVASNKDTDRPPAVGTGGDVDITTGVLEITRGAGIYANTEGVGDAGSVSIEARDHISLDGESSTGTSGIFSSVADNLDTGRPAAIGTGGDIDITTGTLDITRGAGIYANTRGTGDAGNVSIEARDHIFLDGESSNQGPSGIFSSVGDSLARPPAVGVGGDVVIMTESLSIASGASISNSTNAQGSAGTTAIEAREILIDGKNSAGVPSGLYSDVLSSAVGNGGDVRATADSFLITNGGQVAVSSVGQGVGGNVVLSVGRLKLADSSRISASTASGDGGNLSFVLGDYLLLRDNSLITTEAGTAESGGSGGNISITLNDGFVVAVSTENSDITANAYEGNGGTVNITARGLFGIDFRPDVLDTPLSDITSSSRFGSSGTVTINELSPEDFQTEIELPTDTAIPPLAQGCRTPGSQTSSFVVTGRGGLPTNPVDPLSAEAVWHDIAPFNADGSESGAAVGDRSVVATVNVEPADLLDISAPVVEAQGWARAADGSIVLLAQSTAMTERFEQLGQCGIR